MCPSAGQICRGLGAPVSLATAGRCMLSHSLLPSAIAIKGGCRGWKRPFESSSQDLGTIHSGLYVTAKNEPQHFSFSGSCRIPFPGWFLGTVSLTLGRQPRGAGPAVTQCPSPRSLPGQGIHLAHVPYLTRALCSLPLFGLGTITATASLPQASVFACLALL